MVRVIKGTKENKYFMYRVKHKPLNPKVKGLAKLHAEPKRMPNDGHIPKEQIEITDSYMAKFNAYLGRYSTKTRELYLSWYRRFTNHYGTPNNIYNDTMQSYVDHLPNMNPFYKGAVGAYTRCFNKANIFPERIEKPEVRRRTSNIKKDVKFLTHKQIHELINKTPFYISVLTQLYFETGGRLREVINATRDQIDLNKRTITSVKRRSMVDYTPEVHGSRGKNDKDFELFFSKDMAVKLREFLSIYRSQFPFRVPNLECKDHGRAFLYRLKRIAQVLGIHDNLHPHMLRHSLGYFLRADKHFQIEVIQKVLRHASITSTAIYTEATQEEAKRKIDDEVFSEEAKIRDIQRKQKEEELRKSEEDKLKDIISFN